MGWIGSHNFTKASESTAQKWASCFARGPIEARLLQQTPIQFDAWAYRATVTRKVN